MVKTRKLLKTVEEFNSQVALIKNNDVMKSPHHTTQELDQYIRDVNFLIKSYIYIIATEGSITFQVLGKLSSEDKKGPLLVSNNSLVFTDIITLLGTETELAKVSLVFLARMLDKKPYPGVLEITLGPLCKENRSTIRGERIKQELKFINNLAAIRSGLINQVEKTKYIQKFITCADMLSNKATKELFDYLTIWQKQGYNIKLDLYNAAYRVNNYKKVLEPIWSRHLHFDYDLSFYLLRAYKSTWFDESITDINLTTSRFNQFKVRFFRWVD